VIENKINLKDSLMTFKQNGHYVINTSELWDNFGRERWSI